MKTSPRLLAALPLLAALVLPATSQELSLDTTYASGNGQSGNMFDLRAETDIMVTRLDAHIDAGSWTVEVYTSPGGYAGKESNPTAWTLLGSVAVTGMGDVSTGGTKTPLPLVLDIPMSAGETLGFYVTLSNGSSINYTNGSTVGAQYASDGNVTFFEGVGVAYPFAGTFSPRIWNGTIHYTLAGTAPQAGYKELYSIGGGTTNGLQGTSAARFADRNGDGYDDYVLGAPGTNTGRGGFSFHSGATGAPLQTIAGLVSSHAMGAAIANAGDTDGNGTEDVLVGAPGTAPGHPGNAYLFRNGSTFPSGFFLGDPDSGFGAAVASIGDVDGDGRPDLAIGAPRQDTLTSTDAGGFELFSGATGVQLHTAESELSNDHMGAAIIGLGDVDGDLVADFAVGSPGASLDPFSGDKRGRVEVYSGATKQVLLTLFGQTDDSEFGAALVDLGDVTGDGVHDLAVGAPMDAGGLGAVYAFSGASGAALYTVTGTLADGRLGTCLTLLGDTNGNSRAELAAGAPGIAGAWGHVQLVDAGDGAPVTELVQGYLGTSFGASLVPLGDLNGDPLDDFIVTAPGEYTAGHSAAGVTRLVTTLGLPLVTELVGVHSLDAGEGRLLGSNLVNATVLVDGRIVPHTSVSPAELRVSLAPSAPGGFVDVEVLTPEGDLILPASLPRYPALAMTPSIALGDEVEITLSNGHPGIYVLAFSSLKYASPAPFTSFGWFHGLELNGVWTLAAGSFTAGDTVRELTLQAPTAPELAGTTFYVQAFTSQTPLGYVGFSDTLQLQIAPLP